MTIQTGSDRILIRKVSFGMDGFAKMNDRAPVWLAKLGYHPNLVEPLQVIDNLNKAHGMNVNLLSPQTAARILHRLEILIELHETIEKVFFGNAVRTPREVFFPTSAIRAYDEPGKALGPEIIYHVEDRCLVFPTGTFRGRTDVILSAYGVEAGDINDQGDGFTVIETSRNHIHLVASDNFPTVSGRCKLDQDNMVGTGQILPEKDSRMHTWWYPYTEVEIMLARNDGCFVGREVRSVEIVMPSTAYRGVSVFLNHKPRALTSVLAELSEADVSIARTKSNIFKIIDQA